MSIVSAAKRARRSWALSMGLLVAPAAARAEPPRASPPALPTDPVLAQLIEQSLAERPELAQASALARAERERVPQVGTLPDPMLQLGVQNNGFTSWQVGTDPMSYYSIMASQTFPWPGKLRLRSDVAALGAEQADDNVTRVRLSTEADVRRAYLGLMLARGRLSLLDRLDELWRQATTAARARYETGVGAQSDLLRAQLEVMRIREQRWALRVQASTAVQTLNRLRGHALDESIEPPVQLQDVALPELGPAEAAYDDALARSPELASARAGETAAQSSVDLARKGYFPDLTVSFGVMPRGGGMPPMWLATLGLPLPLYAAWKQGPAVDESHSRLAASRENARAVEQVLRVRVDQRRTALAAALETVRLYRQGLLTESEATAQSTLAQYEVGKVTFASVIEADAGYIADRDGYLQALAQAQSLAIQTAEVSLDAPAGVPPSTTGAGGGSSAGGMPATGSSGGVAASAAGM